MISIKPLISGCFFIILLLASCRSKGQNKYIISANIDSSELKYEKFFPADLQKRQDSLYANLNLKPKTKKEKAYKEKLKNDLAIIYAYDDDFSSASNIDSSKSKFVRALSYVTYANDTLKITVGVGFFAFAGVVINIRGNYFEGKFITGSDGEGNLKYNKTDTNYVSDIQVDAVSEKLTLNKNPFSNGNNILMGVYEGTFKPFYEKNVGEVHETKVKWKVIFKCAL